eukprot:GHRR01010484.1.p1 GENE.GHRR01010484.1~~GHRR01010484.1.p1  ORF type:complete len:723 (+),score=236.85 GHRR01010484.1:581-2749(+)
MVNAGDLYQLLLLTRKPCICCCGVQAPWASGIAIDVATGVIMAVASTSDSSECTARSSRLVVNDSSVTATAAAHGSGCGSTTSTKQLLAAANIEGTTVVDLQGAFVMPGIVDPHVHLIPGGLLLAGVQLRGSHSKQEMQRRLAAGAVKLSTTGVASGSELAHAWLMGGGWSEEDWGTEMPDASWIDEATGNIPTFLTRMDNHMALVNTAALKIAGLLGGNNSSVDETSNAGCDRSLIDRDFVTGQPNGLLRECAMEYVRQHIPPPSPQQRKVALDAAGAYFLSRGVTAVGDMGWGCFGVANSSWVDLEQVYDVAAAEGAMPVRVSAYVTLHSWRRLAHRVQTMGDRHHQSGRLVWGNLKEFADGSLGSSTAFMWEPYLTEKQPISSSDSGLAVVTPGLAISSSTMCSSTKTSCSGAHGNSSSDIASRSANTKVTHGTRVIETAELEAMIAGAHKAGLQVAIHAIGDRALDEVLDIFNRVGNCKPGKPCINHRIEHVQHISNASAAARLASLGLIAVPNPQHLLTDKFMLLTKLGASRAGAGKAFAFKTLQDSKVVMGFSSDWPVVEVLPMHSVFAAVYRAEPPVETATAAKAMGTRLSAIHAVVAAHNLATQLQKIDTIQAQETKAATVHMSATRSVTAPEAYVPEERMQLEDVLLRHTSVAAKVIRMEDWVGTLAAGMKGDFIILDRSPFQGLTGKGEGGFGAGMPQVVKTYMDGVCVYGC